jgi:fructosamine-3-kinase
VVAQRAEQLLGSAVVATAPVAGGDVSTAVKLRLSSGRTALLKTLHPAPPHFFEREAAGLAWLAKVTDGVTTPEVLAVDADCLIMEWIEPHRPSADAATGFGRALAHTHAAGATSFGLDETAFGGSTGAGAPRVDGWIGKLPLGNRPLPTWAEFWVERRITPYLKIARDRGQITAEDAATVERAAAITAQVVPEEPPARLHGDLWNGNVLWTTNHVVAIDPAAYAGHREVELAMLALFGLPQLPHVLAAYQEVTPLADGWEDRVAFHQLFPLLVHACVFGGQYGARAARLAGRYL